MLEIKVLEFGYSLEKEYHFMKFNVSGMEKEKKDKIKSILVNIPLGNIKRFLVESDIEEGLNILEYLPEEEYPFNKEVPAGDEIKNVEETVKGFLNR